MDLSLQTINWVVLPSSEAQLPRATVPLAEILDAASVAGFKKVGVETITLDQQGIDVETLVDMLNARNLTCTDIGVLSVSSQDCRQAADRIGTIASRVGARTCVTVVSEAPREAVITRLRQCAQVLSEYGVTMALEFLPYGPLARLEQCIEVCEQVGWSKCGVLLDTWHLFHNPPAWEQLSQLDAAHIALVQVNDAPPPVGDDLVYESRFRRVPPGEGTFDLHRFHQALHDIGYRGVVSPEVLSTTLRQQSTQQIAQTLYAATMQTGFLG